MECLSALADRLQSGVRQDCCGGPSGVYEPGLFGMWAAWGQIALRANPPLPVWGNAGPGPQRRQKHPAKGTPSARWRYGGTRRNRGGSPPERLGRSDHYDGSDLVASWIVEPRTPPPLGVGVAAVASPSNGLRP